MSNSIPIQSQIRKIIFEKFNDPELRFTNDEIFDIVKTGRNIDESFSINEMEPYFKEICDSGLVRNIAQNFTTQWFKLFDNIEKLQCKSCNKEVFLGKSENRICPNPECKASI